MKQAGTSRHGTASLAALVLMLAAAGCGESEQQESCSDFRFDQAAWFAEDAADGSDSPRLEQAESLERCGMLVGKTRREMREMLGAAPGGTPRHLWIYHLGETSFEALQLTLEFGKDGRVTEVWAGQG